VLFATLAVTSFKVFAEPAFNKKIAGSYRVVMLYQGDELPHVSTFTADGAVMTTFVPLTCDGAPGALFTPMHGSWEISLQKGRPVLLFNLLSDQWNSPVHLSQDGSVKALNAYLGPVQIIGTALLTTGPVKGRADIRFPANQFQGGCSGKAITVDFVAERIPPVSEDKLLQE
jgi:hypothetical protein